MRSLAVSVVVAALALPAAAQSARVDATVEAVRKVGPCVVNIATERTQTYVVDPFFERFEQLFGVRSPRRQRTVHSAGSGVIFHEDGYVLTNYHVIRDAEEIAVLLSNNQEHTARPVVADPEMDLAVLAIEGEGPFRGVPFAKSDDLHIGETVIALGNPFGLSNSVSRGVLSAVGRTIQPQRGMALRDLLQTDAAINMGNSGGPLVNLDGELIGINNAMLPRAENIGFAVPIKTVKVFLLELAANPILSAGDTGMTVKDDPDTNDLVIAGVEKDGPADEARLAAGDRIREVDGRKVRGVSDYVVALCTSRKGDRLDIAIERAGKRITASIKLAPFVLARKGGLVVRDLDGKTGTLFDDITVTGVLITNVEGGSPAAEAGLKQGYAIITADGKRVKDARMMTSLFKKKKTGDVVELEILLPVQSYQGRQVLRSARATMTLR